MTIESIILTNSEKSLLFNNPDRLNIQDLGYHNLKDILKINKMDYLLDYDISTFTSNENLEKEYKDKILETMKKQSDRNDSYSSDNIIDLFIQSDPTTNRKYVVWLIKSYLRGGIKKIEDLLSRAKPALESFIILTKNKKLSFNDPSKPWTNEKDINNYFGLVSGIEKGREKMGLENIIDKYNVFLESKVEKKKIEESAKDDIKLYFENDFVKVYHPLTEPASCLIGRGTRWCTSANENNMFDKYNKDGPLYVIIPKNPEYPGEKYQYHHESESYMNEQDEDIQNPKELFQRFGMDFEIPNLLIEIGDQGVESLKKLPDDIKKLNLSGLSIKKIPDLSRFKDLYYIDLSNTKIRKIENLDNLVNLEKLYLPYTYVSKIENLDNLVKLQQLYMGDTKIRKIENLDNLVNLQNLSLNNTKISKIENLDSLVNLETLDLPDTKISKIENLDNLVKLKQLYINDTKISRIENLDNLVNLQILNLYNTKISNIENLENLVNLQILNLYNTNINKIENLDKLVKLKQLYLNSTKINRIENLNNLLNLEILVLSKTNISKIENLESLKNLKELILSNTNISNIENLEGLNNLEIIDLVNTMVNRETPSYKVLPEELKEKIYL